MAEGSPPGRERRRRAWLIPLVAVAAVLVLLAALGAYLLLQRPVPQKEPPAVTLTYPSGCGPVTIDIASAAPEAPLADFASVANRSGTEIGRIVALADGGSNGDLSFSDLDRDARLTAGDRFLVRTTADGAYEMSLRWQGTEVARLQWSLPPRLSVNFTGTSSIADGFSFDVASTSCSVLASHYKVNLAANASVAPAVPLSSTMTFTIAGETYTVAWNDNADTGRLGAGDDFRVTHAGVLPRDTSFVFRLLWEDGSELANASYRTPPALPVVVLDFPLGGATATIDVQSASPSLPLSAFAATLVRGNETSGAINPLADGATNGNLSFADRDGNGNLSAGDRFTARVEAGFYSLKVWYGAYQVGEQGWGETPAVAFGSPLVGPAYVQVTVAGVSLPTRLSEFSATVTRNGTEIGRIDVLGLPGSGTLSFTDIDGGGKLTTGDFFRVTTTGTGSYELILRWQGPGFGLRVVASTTWTI